MVALAPTRKVVAMYSLAQYHRLMPESFDAEDLDEFDQNPWDELEQLQQTWNAKDYTAPWSVDKPWVSEHELLELNVDWHQYPPPALLRKAINTTSPILSEIIRTSIENVEYRIAEEKRRKLEAERMEQRRLSQRHSDNKGKERDPPPPIITTPSGSSSPSDVARSATSSTSAQEITPNSTYSLDLIGLSPSKPEKKSRSAFKRLFGRSSERGESSSAGTARETLFKKIETRFGNIDLGSADITIVETIPAWTRAGLFKSTSNTPDVECVSCLDEFPSRDTVKITCHSYCKACFILLVSSSVKSEQQWPPKCCLNPIPFKTILKNVPDDLKKIFHARSIEWEIPVSERLYCSAPGCSIWVKPNRINLAKRSGRCDKGHFTCTICRGPAHGSNECPEDQDLNLTNILAEQEGWKRCYSCHALVEHKEACQHMTCRCGAEFCYVCGLRWQTCSCTGDQLTQLKEDVQNQRTLREWKAKVDAEELQSWIAQIEEMEKQEAIIAALARQEQERVEEEEWQREVKKRIRLERIRRQDIDTKFQKLKELLDELHEVQFVMIESTQVEEAQGFAAETLSAREELQARHEVTLLDFDNKRPETERAKEQDFLQEFAARVSHEKEIEDGYSKDLHQFWSEDNKIEEKVEEAMIPLLKRLDGDYLEWDTWKEQQMESFRQGLEKERSALQSDLKKELDNFNVLRAETAEESRRRMVAQKKWFQQVAFERETMLSAMEIHEMEGDADTIFSAKQESDLRRRS